MKAGIAITGWLLFLVFGNMVIGREIPPQIHSDRPAHTSGSMATANDLGDTINLMAAHRDPTNGPGEPQVFGDFETATWAPAWNGWTSWDATLPGPEHHWQITNHGQADTTNLVAWCGTMDYPSCDPGVDPPGGYGNGWHEWLRWRRTVRNPDLSTIVWVTGVLQVDVESSYDEVALGYLDSMGKFIVLWQWDGRLTVPLDVTTHLYTWDYHQGDEIVLVFRFRSGKYGSDEDCYWTSNGALALDDLRVQANNGPAAMGNFTDFQDGTFGYWEPVIPPGVGDYAKIWNGLQDLDPCRFNDSPQVAFIDDGLVVPGTGGSPCLNWCYGPGGHIAPTTGGFAGEDFHLENYIQSPVMDWPGDDYDRMVLEYDVYHHEDLSDDAPGIFTIWGVRSADTDDSAGWGAQVIEDQPWLDRNSLYYADALYERRSFDVSSQLGPGIDQVQVRLGVYELGWVWGWTGDDGYPAPYFDNVTVKAFKTASGPDFSAYERELPQDAFPENGTLDTGDLGSLHVRFDTPSEGWVFNNPPGDKLIVEAHPFQEYGHVQSEPLIGYKVSPNPLFDSYRTSPRPLEGTIPGHVAYIQDPYPTSEFAFDLPDSGFLFPGDVVHYYVVATDVHAGNTYTATIPADTTGFAAGFEHPLGYHPAFTFRALPSLRPDGQGGVTQPPILFWDESNDYRGLRTVGWPPDHEDDGTPGVHKWYRAFEELGLVAGRDYDIYVTRDPDYGDSNSLGGMATLEQIAGYRTIIYTSGPHAENTLGDGDPLGRQADDLGLIRSWLELGDRNLLLTGDHLAQDLATNQGQAGISFMAGIMGVFFIGEDAMALIDGQSSPRVRAASGQPVLGESLEWLVYTGCPGPLTFDAVEPMSAVVLGDFLDPAGAAGTYSCIAATLNHPPSAPTSRVVYLPYDPRIIRTMPGDKSAAPIAARCELLRDILVHFGEAAVYQVVGTPGLEAFAVANHPNPFNPVTRIVYTVPRAGHLSLKVYDVRGMLVKTLVDDRVEAGADQVAVWDGADDGGAAVSSGVYFWEARTGGEVKVGKMALIR